MMTTLLSVREKELYQKIKAKTLVFSDSTKKKLYSGIGGAFDWGFIFHDFFVDPEALDIYSDLFWEKYRHLAPLQIGGLETSGVPLMLALILKAHKLGIPATGFYIRKERKTRGLCSHIDTELSDEPIIIVDDAFKSGLTAQNARLAIAEQGKEIELFSVLVNFNWNRGYKWSSDNNIAVHNFFTPEDFGLTQGRYEGIKNHIKRDTQKVSYDMVWQFTADDALPTHVVPKSTPLLVNERIIFGDDSGKCWCLEAASGTHIWCYDTKTRDERGIWSDPVSDGRFVYLGAFNGNLYCLEILTGKARWIAPLCEQIASNPIFLEELGLVIINLGYSRESNNGGIAAVDTTTGTKIWEIQTDKELLASVAHVKGTTMLIVSDEQANLFAVEANDGSKIWNYKTDEPIKNTPSICIDRRTVYTCTNSGIMKVNSVDTGELVFEYDIKGFSYAQVLFTEEYAIVPSGDRALYIFRNDTYELIKRIQTRSKLFCKPNILGENIIFGNNAGVLEEINLASFNTESAIMFPDSITNPVLVEKTSNYIFISTYMNELYCLERNYIK